MKKSLQQIEDYYFQKGLTGTALRKATENDKEYQEIRAEKYSRLTKKFKVTPEEKRKYTLSTDEDYEILGKINQLEKQKLSKQDKQLINLIRTQLEHHWREPLIESLDELLEKYD